MSDGAVMQAHPASVDAYIRHGWSLVPIPPGTKGPRGVGWNRKEARLIDHSMLPTGYGIGLAHAYSGTMALDIDHWGHAEAAMRERGLNLRSFFDAPDAVTIESGNSGHGKLLYRMPFGAALPSKKLHVTTPTGERVNFIDFRCGTGNGMTVQDVLPPSIHPVTRRPYQWGGKGRWDNLPIIPTELLDWWQGIIGADNSRVIKVDGGIKASWGEIESALYAISPHISRSEWITIGMALHWSGEQTGRVDDALALWDQWSSGSHKYPGPHEIAVQWRAFSTKKPNTVTIGSLFHAARQVGWTRPAIDASELFGATQEDRALPPLDVVSLINGVKPKPPKMEIDLWPDILKTRAIEVSDSVGCDPVVPLFAGLAAVCGVIDAQIRLELMPGFQVPPVLWLMTIGAPADKKSPGSKPMLSLLSKLAEEDIPRYKQELLQYEAREAAYASAKKQFLTWAGSAEAQLSNSPGPSVPEVPEPPVRCRITVSDITSQALVRQAAGRPRGLLLYLDEMNGWVRKMTDKTSIDDRSTWVVAYESERYELDRVGDGSILAKNFAISIYGNMQPQVFRENVKALASDGLIQRFIPVVVDPTMTRLNNPVADDKTHAAAWENMLRVVYAIPKQTYRLSYKAFKAYREFQQWYEEAKRDERVMNAGPEYMTAFGKLEGLVGRLALIFHVIENPFSPEVSKSVIDRVTDLVRGFVIPAYRYAYGTLAEAAVFEFDEWLMNYIIQISGECKTVTLRDLKNAARSSNPAKTDWTKEQLILDAMHTLEKSEWVAMLDEDRKKVTWAINPDLPSTYSSYREGVIKAKQRTLDYKYRHAYAKGSIPRKIVKGYNPETMEENDE